MREVGIALPLDCEAFSLKFRCLEPEVDVEGFRCHTEEGGTTIFCVREGKGEPTI